MTVQYILDPDTNTITQRTFEDTSSNLEEFIAAMASDREIITPTLPRDCVQFRSTESSGWTYIIHKPADILKFGVSGQVDGLNVIMENLEVAVPDRLYFFKGSSAISSRACRFVFSQATNREDFGNAQVAQPWLPNMYSSLGKFCGGRTFEDTCVGSGSISSRIDELVDYMETSMFNNDLNDFLHLIPQPTKSRAEDCYGVEIEGLDWSTELRTAVESGTWNSPIKAVLRMHMATKRMLAERTREDVIRSVRGDLESATLHSFSSIYN
jgi:hypothetical protein